jgi:hypothetical protein
MVKITVEQMTDFQTTLSRIKVRLEGLNDFYSSNLEEVLQHRSFQELGEMGPKIIPYVIKRATANGFSKPILILLRELTRGEFYPIGYPPTNSPKSYYLDIANALKWYVNSKYYTDDPYYGLMEPYEQDKS